MTEWSELKEKVLLDCVRRLESLGLKFAIMRVTGERIGSLDVVTPKQRKKRGPNKYGPRELKNYITPILSEMKIGDEASIPVGKFDLKSLNSSITSTASHMWGKKSYVSSALKNSESVSILRVL